MDKEKALQSLNDSIQWAKDSMDSARKNNVLTDIKYLSGHLEAYEGLKQKIEDGYWD